MPESNHCKPGSRTKIEYEIGLVLGNGIFINRSIKAVMIIVIWRWQMKLTYAKKIPIWALTIVDGEKLEKADAFLVQTNLQT